MAGSPTVTVLLPAFNAAAWLGPAVESVLAQSFADLELLVMDDGSTDATPRILARYLDERMRVIRDKNRGLVSVLNHGIELARGKYVARMDADDVAHPRRLELQTAFLERHRDVGICGTWFRTTHGSRRVSVCPPTGHDDISAHLFFRSPFGHPTVMMRRDFLETRRMRYDAAARHAEDFDFWVRARQWTRFANLPRFLLEYRSHPKQVSSGQSDAQKDTAGRIRLRQLDSLNVTASAEERALHLCICDDQWSFASQTELETVGAWLDKLEHANMQLNVFSIASFARALDWMWYGCCLRASVPPRQALIMYRRKRYWKTDRKRLQQRMVLAYKALRHAVVG